MTVRLTVLDLQGEDAAPLRTSQIAPPQEACDAVDATEGYEASVANLAATSLDSDTVFSDGYTLQMTSVTRSVDEGYVLSLDVPV